MLQPGRRVAERGHGEAQHRRADRGVRDLVEGARLEAALEVNMSRVRQYASGFDPREAPARAPDFRRRSVGLITNREQRITLVEVLSGIGNVAAVGEEKMRDR